LPRLVGNISRSSEFKTMQLDKIKGTLVDFNELEHLLDDVEYIGAWQLELRKCNDDPLEVDELILHVQQRNGVDEQKLVRDLRARFIAQIEIQPNRIVFHDAEMMRQLQGVGSQLKEEKIVDHRPGATKKAVAASADVEFPDEPALSPAAPGNGRVEKVEVIL